MDHVIRFIDGLKDYGIKLISGLAYGIDITAHKHSLSHQIPNIAVLGHGLHTIYPIHHKSTANRIMKGGMLLTEFTSQTRFDKENFPKRNRIIAGLADVVIVIESAARGGSIITAHFANDFSKDVFAIPGRIGDPMSEGCNNLIKQHKAHMLTSIEDILYIMRWDELEKQKQIQRSLFNDLDKDEKSIIHILADVSDLSFDNIMIRCNKAPSSMANLLLQLEFKGIIKSLPGKRYRLIK
ncbi:MAG: DNA-processing protein DprA, partial [Bacteroidota bacterium]